MGQAHRGALTSASVAVLGSTHYRRHRPRFGEAMTDKLDAATSATVASPTPVFSNRRLEKTGVGKAYLERVSLLAHQPCSHRRKVGGERYTSVLTLEIPASSSALAAAVRQRLPECIPSI